MFLCLIERFYISGINVLLMREICFEDVISRKFGLQDGGWCTIRGGYGVGCWKEIRQGRDILFDKVVLSVGDGRRVSFWKDNCCREVA